MSEAVGTLPAISEGRCRAVVSERSQGLCEARLDVPGVCRGVAESKHHRRHVSQGGLWQPSNVVDICGHGTIGCHGYLEHNPATGRRLGLYLFTGSLPASTPARLSFRGMTGWYLLADDGCITWLSTEALARLKR